jgi:hypothetical protein
MKGPPVPPDEIEHVVLHYVMYGFAAVGLIVLLLLLPALLGFSVGIPSPLPSATVAGESP